MIDITCIIGEITRKSLGENHETKSENQPSTYFKCPIEYLPPGEVQSLSAVVATDLELTVYDPSMDSIYNHIFRPTNQYGRDMIPRWGKSYTTNIPYLTETQVVVEGMADFPESIDDTRHDQLNEIWRSIKCDPDFFNRFSYVDWDCLKFLNTHPTFLQAITLANMTAPVLSFFVPILFFIFPFIILKIQRIPIDSKTYFNTLKEIAKHHFIGKSISSMQNFSITSFIYLIVTVVLYFYQIYQNYTACSRFYSNIRKVSEDLMNLKTYVDYSIGNMKTFISKYSKLVTYKEFIGELSVHLSNLEELAVEIGNIQPFTVSIYKITEIGSLLKKYYNIYENAEFGKSLLYSFEFEGYLNNMKGAYLNLIEGKINKAMFSKKVKDLENPEEEKEEEDKEEKKKGNKKEKEDIPTIFKDQYYPTHTSGVTNDCQIKKNLIITGPNASGKTTYLKTTMLNIIFTQQIGFGFYSSAKLTPYTHIHSYLNIPDTSGRDSLFQAESRRCKEIIDIINENKDGRHFAIFDELYSGTNPIEASKSAYAFLLYLSEKTNVDFILTTHYRTVCKKLRKHPNIKCLKMNARELATGHIEYTYQISSGISKIQGAVKVLKEMNYPHEIIETIENM